jgi:nucleoid-associated protein YgaU
MSVFSFVSDIGHKVFGGNDDPAAAIKQAIEADNPGVENLEVTFENGFVTLGGSAATAEAVEKAVLIAGNVKGVGRVVSNIALPADGTGGSLVGDDGQPVAGSAAFYTIKSGDTLSAIAQQHYGDAAEYPKIFAANREVIKDPDKIFVGQVIRLPQAG